MSEINKKYNSQDLEKSIKHEEQKMKLKQINNIDAEKEKKNINALSQQCFQQEMLENSSVIDWIQKKTINDNESLIQIYLNAEPSEIHEKSEYYLNILLSDFCTKSDLDKTEFGRMLELIVYLNDILTEYIKYEEKNGNLFLQQLNIEFNDNISWDNYTVCDALKDCKKYCEILIQNLEIKKEQQAYEFINAELNLFCVARHGLWL